MLQEWQQLSTYVNQLHAQDIHTVLALDASIPVTGEAFKRALDAVSKLIFPFATYLLRNINSIMYEVINIKYLKY